MARWAPQRRDVLEALAAEILHNYPRGRVIVAVDGGVEARRLADDLARLLVDDERSAFRASLADFLLPRAQRTGDGLDAVDLSQLRRVLLEPFRLGGSTGFVTAAFDAVADAPVESRWVTGPADALLLVDGEDLLSGELRGTWNTSIRVEDGDAAARPPLAVRAVASAVIDARDPEHPRRVFSDSC